MANRGDIGERPEVASVSLCKRIESHSGPRASNLANQPDPSLDQRHPSIGSLNLISPSPSPHLAISPPIFLFGWLPSKSLIVSIWVIIDTHRHTLALTLRRRSTDGRCLGAITDAQHTIQTMAAAAARITQQ